MFKGIVSVSIVFVFVSTVQGATINIPADYATIQDAILYAQQHNTVMVSPGTYVENIDFMGKPIKVMNKLGPEVTIIDFLCTPFFQADGEDELSALVKKISRLETTIKAHPKGLDVEVKKAELADVKFKAGRIMVRKRAESSDPGIKAFFEKEGEKYFEGAVILYRQLGGNFEDEALAEAAKMRKRKTSNTKLRKSGYMLLKAGISCYFWKDLFTPGSKEWHLKIEDADIYMAWALATAPLDDPVHVWGWLYMYLICRHQGQENTCRALRYSIMNLDRAAVEMKKTLHRKSDMIWLILDPLEGMYLHNAEDLKKRGDYSELAAWGKLVAERYSSAGIEPGPLGVRMLLEYAKAVQEAEGHAEAGKILVDAAEKNCGNPLGGEILPHLRDWVDFCSTKLPHNNRILRQAKLALANEYRMEGEYVEALAFYSELLDPGKEDRFLRECGPEILRCKGLCCHHLKLWSEAAHAFEESYLESEEAGDKPEDAVIMYWHAALVELAKSTNLESDRKKAEEAKKRLRARGVDPSATLPAIQVPAPYRAVSFPPVGIFDEPLISSPPLICLKSPPKPGQISRVDKPLWKAVEKGLEWLVRHQSTEGYWDCDCFHEQCRSKRDSCSGMGHPLNDSGVTGLALLALLDGGSHLGGGPYQEAVSRGIKYLCDIQDPEDGSLTTKESTHYMYDHGIACLALTEAYRRFPWPSLAVPAERAIGFIHAAKNEDKAWRYNIGESDPVEQNDMSVTGWMMKSLVSAARGGLTFYEKDLRDGLAYIDELTDPRTGRTGYMEKGSYGAREMGDEEMWPFEMVEAMTAMAMVCRHRAGTLFDELDTQAPAMAAGARVLAEKPPQKNLAGRIDYYYWHCGCEAMALKGGAKFLRWKKAAAETVLNFQETKGCAKGSWDPALGPWGDNGGRVYSTALCILALEELLSAKE